MPKTIKVALSTPLEGHHGTITELEFREPKWDEIMTHGEPFRVHQVEGGEPFVHVNYAVLRAYAEACLLHPDGPLLALEPLGIDDSRTVAKAMADFFP